MAEFGIVPNSESGNPEFKERWSGKNNKHWLLFTGRNNSQIPQIWSVLSAPLSLSLNESSVMPISSPATPPHRVLAHTRTPPRKASGTSPRCHRPRSPPWTRTRPTRSSEKRSLLQGQQGRNGGDAHCEPLPFSSFLNALAARRSTAWRCRTPTKVSDPV
jgi:hypothetical protein